MEPASVPMPPMPASVTRRCAIIKADTSAIAVSRPISAIVEGRTALKSKRQPTPNHTDSSDQFIQHDARAAHGHVVLHLAHAIGVEEAGNEDVGVRPVELLVAEWVAVRGDPEAPTLGVVQDGGEDARGIEVR